MKIVRRLKNICNNLLLNIWSSNNSTVSVSNKVPFISQFANPEYAEEVLKNGKEAVTDPSWPQTGANTAEEYATWSTTMCGMACTAMALHYYYGASKPIVELARDALENGVYAEGVELSAMKYQEYVQWIKKYNVKASIYTKLSLAGIKYLLAEGELVVVSVNPNIRGYNTAPEVQKGGHLVLVTGYDSDNRTLTINNPSGFVSLSSHHHHVLSEEVFKKYFAGRGLSLNKQK